MQDIRVFSKNIKIPNFMKIRPAGADNVPSGRMDRDEAKSRLNINRHAHTNTHTHTQFPLSPDRALKSWRRHTATIPSAVRRAVWQ